MGQPIYKMGNGWWRWLTQRPQGGGILGDVIAELREALGERIDSLEIERTVLGLFFTGVKLSDGEGGLCFTPIKSIPQAVCCPGSARAMPDSGMRGKRVMEVLDEMLLGNPLKKAIGIATINALSSAVWRERPPEGYAIRIGMDPMDEASIPDDAFVAVVGALVPYLRCCGPGEAFRRPRTRSDAPETRRDGIFRACVEGGPDASSRRLAHHHGYDAHKRYAGGSSESCEAGRRDHRRRPNGQHAARRLFSGGASARSEG